MPNEDESYEEENNIDEQNDDYLDSEQEEESEPEYVAKNDYEDYGKKVKKRINQEVSKRKVLEDENKALSNRLSNLETQVHSRQEAHDNADLDKRMDTMRAKRKEMYDVGDIDPQVEDEWQDLRYEQKQANARKEQAPQQQQAQQARAIPQAQQAWMDENRQWYGVDEERTASANEVFQSVLDDGYSEEHPGAYKEFNKRMNTNTPPPEEPNRPAAAPPTAMPTGSGGAPKPKGKLTQSDFSMMREMGLDPQNVEHRKQLLANRRTA